MSTVQEPVATRVAILTPPGRGAVATIAVFGAGAVAAVDACFCSASGKPLSARATGEICYGRWLDATAGEEVVVACRADNSVEIHCHGGLVAPDKIAADLQAQGCERVEWSVWAAQQDDPLAVAARAALSQARSARTAAILLDQLGCVLRDRLAHCGRLVERGQSDAAIEEIDTLIERGQWGVHLTQPWRVVIGGEPNVGKSSLLNALVGFERSIVVDSPGTTRDVVTNASVIDGWPVLLADTAGLRRSDDPIEAAGVTLAEQQLAEADLVLLLFDSSKAWSAADAELPVRWPAAMIVHNKADLPQTGELRRPAGLAVSATVGDGIEKLLEQISKRLVPNVPGPGSAVPFTLDQLESLQRAKRALESGKFIRALKHIACCS